MTSKYNPNVRRAHTVLEIIIIFVHKFQIERDIWPSTWWESFLHCEDGNQFYCEEAIVHHADGVLWMINHAMFIHRHFCHWNPSISSFSRFLHSIHETLNPLRLATLLSITVELISWIQIVCMFKWSILKMYKLCMYPYQLPYPPHTP